MNSKLPTDAMRLVEESRVILEIKQERVIRRIAFLDSVPQCLREVVEPAAEEFAAQFPAYQLKFEIEGREFPLTPELLISTHFETPLPNESFAVEFCYRPANQDERLEFSMRMDGADWVRVNEFPISDILREGVLMNLAATLRTALKQRVA